MSPSLFAKKVKEITQQIKNKVRVCISLRMISAFHQDLRGKLFEEQISIF